MNGLRMNSYGGEEKLLLKETAERGLVTKLEFQNVINLAESAHILPRSFVSRPVKVPNTLSDLNEEICITCVGTH